MERSWRIPASLQEERLDKVVTLAPFAQEERLGRQRARALVEHGRVELDRRVVRLSSHRVKGGELLHVKFDREEPEAPPPVRVLYEDGALLVVEKPAGIPSEP